MLIFWTNQTGSTSATIVSNRKWCFCHPIHPFYEIFYTSNKHHQKNLVNVTKYRQSDRDAGPSSNIYRQITYVSKFQIAYALLMSLSFKFRVP